MSITCGNHRDEAHRYLTVKHDTTKSVGDCYNPNIETFLCGWLYEKTELVGDEEGGFESYVREVPCDALAYETTDGWHCEAGHEHLTYGSERQQAEERIEAAVEYMASRDVNIAGRLDASESYKQIAGV